MATKGRHAKITRDVLHQLGFTDDAITVVVNANLKVDDYQGNTPWETNLHAMAGCIPGSRKVQTSQDVSTAVQARVTRGKVDIGRLVDGAAVAPDKATQDESIAEARRILGRILHTIQDAAFHNFEPWTAKSVEQAIVLDPRYMFGHGVRDLGVIAADVAAHHTSQSSFVQGWIGGRPSDSVYAPQIAVGAFRSSAAGQPNETGGFISLRWGGAPTSPPRDATAPHGPGGSSTLSPIDIGRPDRLFPEAEGGPDALIRATNDTMKYVNAILHQLGSNAPILTGRSMLPSLE